MRGETLETARLWRCSPMQEQRDQQDFCKTKAQLAIYDGQQPLSHVQPHVELETKGSRDCGILTRLM